MSAYDKKYPKESRNISVYNVYDIIIDDFRVNKEKGLCVLWIRRKERPIAIIIIYYNTFVIFLCEHNYSVLC